MTIHIDIMWLVYAGCLFAYVILGFGVARIIRSLDRSNFDGGDWFFCILTWPISLLMAAFTA